MNEETLFHEALGKSNAQERAAFLDQACAGRPELRAAVEALLSAHDGAGRFLAPDSETLAGTNAVETAHAATLEDTSRTDASRVRIADTSEFRGTLAAGMVISNRYTLLEKIGEGGMGEVWVAKQTEPVKRKVALKLIKTGMDSRAVLQRFEQERQALALMDHPNIAKVLDAGLTPTGQPFFVMELVNGLPLNTFCDELKLTPKERLDLFVPICQAVQHAHQKGIVHRDLKPANILITMIDAKPVPKVIDFGVAKATAGKLTDASLSTQFGAVVGTLEYMSPEQAGFSGEDIDTRADIYSLGVILYELLTGLRPIDAARLRRAALTEMVRIIREDEPSKPSTRLSTDASTPSLAALRQTEPRKLMALLRRDLDWVVMKCLEKHRERRYETADALARDVKRYLNGDAVEACPPSVGYRLGKFLKRNRGPVLAASVVLLALVVGFIGTAWGLVQAERARLAEVAQRKIAVEEKTKAEGSEALALEQRARAETREEQAIDAVKKFRDAVANNPELKNNPALESLRKTLLKEPLAFFKALRDRLQADKDTRPESLARLAGAGFDLGNLTYEIGDRQDALIAHHEALAIRRKLAEANPSVTQFQSDLAASHNNIGVLLGNAGKPAEALQALESALAIRRKLAEANPSVTQFQSDLAASHNNIGNLLGDTGKPAEALQAWESALAIQRKLAREHPESPDFGCRLGATLNNIAIIDFEAKRFGAARDRLREAIVQQKQALAAYPRHPQYRQFLTYYLMNILSSARGMGDPEGVAEAERELAKLRESDPVMQALDARLSAIIKGGQHPKDNAERCRLAQLAYEKALHATAARLWGEALAADPTLADDRRAGHRYNAACAAALAAAGNGKDDPAPDDAAKTKLREQALAWLSADLAVWTKLVASGPPQEKQFMAQTLKHWQEDADLAGIRDEKASAKLPDDERVAFKQLWKDVEALQTKLQAGK